MQECMSSFISSINVDPTFHRAVYNLGTCLYQHGKFGIDWAKTLVTIAQKMQPDVKAYKAAVEALKDKKEEEIPVGTILEVPRVTVLWNGKLLKGVTVILQEERLSFISSVEEGEDLQIVSDDGVDLKRVKQVCLIQEQSLLPDETSQKDGDRCIWISTKMNVGEGTSYKGGVVPGLWLVFDSDIRARLFCLVVLLSSNLKKAQERNLIMKDTA